MPQPVGVRRNRRRESRPQGVKVGRKGFVFIYRNGVRVRDSEIVLSAVGRKV